MGIARSSFYAEPEAKPDDATIIAEIRAITDEFEGYGYRPATFEHHNARAPVKTGA